MYMYIMNMSKPTYMYMYSAVRHTVTFYTTLNFTHCLDPWIIVVEQSSSDNNIHVMQLAGPCGKAKDCRASNIDCLLLIKSK